MGSSGAEGARLGRSGQQAAEELLPASGARVGSAAWQRRAAAARASTLLQECALKEYI